MPAKKSTPKSKNQLGLLAGMDKDIESAKHDDIMLWLDQNLTTILPNLLPLYFGSNWVTHDSASLVEGKCMSDGYVIYAYPRLVPYTVPFPHIPSRIDEKVWEYPIHDKKSGGLVGFCDLYVRGTYFAVQGGSLEADKDNYGAQIYSIPVYFEVKTTIQLGPLLRQINLYKMHTNLTYAPSYYVVVSPDVRYVDILKEQDVLFVEYPG